MLIKNNPKTSPFLHQSRTGPNSSMTAQKSATTSSITSPAPTLREEQRWALSKAPRGHQSRPWGCSGSPAEPCCPFPCGCAAGLSCRAALPPGPAPARRRSRSCAGTAWAPARGSGSSLQTPWISCCPSCSRSSPAPSASRWNTPAGACPGSQGCWAGGLSSSLQRSPPGNGVRSPSLGSHWASSLFPGPGRFGWRQDLPNNFLITVLKRGRRKRQGRGQKEEGNLS